MAEVVPASEDSGPAITPEAIVIATATTCEIFIFANNNFLGEDSVPDGVF